jgi:hypothetical protein
MNLEDKKEISYRIENEGFHYCFEHYSNFEEIKDEKFHELRKAYLEAAKNIEEYIKYDELEDSYDFEGNEELYG